MCIRIFIFSFKMCFFVLCIYMCVCVSTIKLYELCVTYINILFCPLLFHWCYFKDPLLSLCVHLVCCFQLLCSTWWWHVSTVFYWPLTPSERHLHCKQPFANTNNTIMDIPIPFSLWTCIRIQGIYLNVAWLDHRYVLVLTHCFPEYLHPSTLLSAVHVSH